MAALPDLITPAYLAQALAPAGLTSAQLAFSANAATAASTEIRRWCFDRDFTQTTYSGEIYPVTLDGFIRLSQVPVNQIISIQTNPTDVLFITNGSAQQASVQFSLTGDLATGQTITGFNLTSVTNGTVTTANVAFVANQTVSDVAVLINAVGGGWSALTNISLDSWPVTQLYGGLVGQGAPSIDGEPAKYSIFLDYVNNARFHPDDGQKTGLVWVGTQRSGISDRWGPYPADWTTTPNDPGVVCVSYNAGFAVIPSIVQEACAETVKAMLMRLRINPYLMSESAGEYAYDLAHQALLSLPDSVKQALSQYRINNA